jgi:hypothetical protein
VLNLPLILVKLHRLTSFHRISLCVVPDERCLGLSYLHETVLLDFSQSNILFVPLKAAGQRVSRRAHGDRMHTHCCPCPPADGGAFLSIPFGLGFDADLGRGGSCGGSSMISVDISHWESGGGGWVGHGAVETNIGQPP